MARFWKSRIVDLAPDLPKVLRTATIVRSIYVNTTLSAHACNLDNGSDTLVILPASLAAGTVIDFGGELGVLFDNSLIVDPDNSATGSITIFYIEKQ